MADPIEFIASLLPHADRRRFLARQLVFNLSIAELDWAHPSVREACKSRAMEIVADIGWPKEQWLKPRVSRWIAFRNEVHRFANGDRPDCPEEPK